jgi:hypothetical protein
LQKISLQLESPDEKKKKKKKKEEEEEKRKKKRMKEGRKENHQLSSLVRIIRSSSPVVFSSLG